MVFRYTLSKTKTLHEKQKGNISTCNQALPGKDYQIQVLPRDGFKSQNKNCPINKIHSQSPSLNETSEAVHRERALAKVLKTPT